MASLSHLDEGSGEEDRAELIGDGRTTFLNGTHVDAEPAMYWQFVAMSASGHSDPLRAYLQQSRRMTRRFQNDDEL
jgi:hypothetical protein